LIFLWDILIREYFSGEDKNLIFGIIIKNEANFNKKFIKLFVDSIGDMLDKKEWSKEEIVKLFFKMIPNFEHKETGKYLDGRM
jgi:hypothetical protein